jgi:uncharacterized protein
MPFSLYAATVASCQQNLGSVLGLLSIAAALLREKGVTPEEVIRARLTPPPESFAALKARIAETLAALEVIEPAELDGFVGREMRFARGERQLDSSAENFLLPFALPNFYFHATTTYDNLRKHPTDLEEAIASVV